jgi:hypothetical protein
MKEKENAQKGYTCISTVFQAVKIYLYILAKQLSPRPELVKMLIIPVEVQLHLSPDLY